MPMRRKVKEGSPKPKGQPAAQCGYILFDSHQRDVPVVPRSGGRDYKCGCPECHPEFWCIFRSDQGVPCRRPRCSPLDGSKSSYCLDHHFELEYRPKPMTERDRRELREIFQSIRSVADSKRM